MPTDPDVITAYDALRLSVDRHPDKTAIVYESERLTYREVLDHIDRSARHLAAEGIGRGRIFAAYSQNRPELMFCYYAAAKIGAIFVPLNPNLTAAEVEYILDHSGAELLYHEESAPRGMGSAASKVRCRAIEGLREPLRASVEDPPVVSKPEDDFLIIYTSGTTGTPKAIVLDHAAQTKAPLALATMWGLAEGDVTLVALPLGYLYGLSTAAAVGLQSGGKVVILSRFHPADVLAALVSHQATVYHGVPTMFAMMLDYCEQRGLSFDLSGMRQLICAGAPLPDEMRKRFAARFGKELQNYYAMTEATPVFGKFFDDPRSMPDGAVGKAAPGLIVKIVNGDGTECGTGEEGEILVRAAATMKRYMNAPDQTAAAFQDGLFRSGDLGRRDREGYYFITGRIKDVIIRGGANISPAEVEAALAAHPAVQDAAVVGCSDAIFGEVPVAFVVCRHSMTVTEQELADHAGKTLSDFKVPRRYFFVRELPQGKTGKVDKAALKKLVAQPNTAAAPVGR
ncbi:MAG: class I adenylate-forming enzyme family protein [Parvibaculaceae bacterium]